VACMRIFKYFGKGTENGHRSVINLSFFQDGNKGSLVPDGRENSQ
jgi:hypothetical protein